MNKFQVKKITASDMVSELNKIGFDDNYSSIAVSKFQYENLKIFNLSSAQANILKQTALSVGADCATHRDVICGNIENSNAILGGSLSQLKKIAEKLKQQPFSLKILGETIISELNQKERKTKIAGILNVTPNSFSDGGMYLDPEKAITHALKLIEDGADILDIGAESTKPYSEPVSDEEQIRRISPVLSGLKGINTPISIDTRSSKVAEYCLKNGASIINDVSGFDYDKNIADIVSNLDATIIIQHSQGSPENMQDNPIYKDVIEEIYFELEKKVEFANNKGIKNIILDVGIGFGKTKEHNYEILNRIEEFYSLNLPIMVGVSRKSLLGLQDSNNNELKDALSLAISYPLMLKKVDYLRVHNVKLHKQLLTSAIL